MILPKHKTKIVCTIGPASESPEIIDRMIEAGMDVARLNFSHGDFDRHRRVIQDLRACASRMKRRLALLADLPGPKIRIGTLSPEPIELRPNDLFILTTREEAGNDRRVSVTFPSLPRVVQPGDILFLNDGFIQLEVVNVDGNDVHSRVLVGGELRSRKGLNLPGIDLGMTAFTERDRQCLQFALEQGVDVISQSFVETGGDLLSVRAAADALGYHPMVIAKIERSRALNHVDEILDAADGIMIARGDLGVEIPIEQIAMVQKELTLKANLLGKPVITATQMLESMTHNRRPTRAEATDVANAILDGTDCVMLSGESATGAYPVEAVRMLARIAEVTEPHLSDLKKALKPPGQEGRNRLTDLIALSVEATLNRISPATVLVPTLSGATARSIARFRPKVWITAVSPHEATCRHLQLTYGVYPVCEPDPPENWKTYAKTFLSLHEMKGDLVLLTEGPSTKNPEGNHRMEIIDLKRKGEALP